MPPGGAGVRAEQLATLERLAHEALTSDEIGRLLDELAPHEDSLEYDSNEASLIRLVRREWEKARRVPAELRAEMTRAASLAMPVWVKARQESDFSQFLPALRANFDLRRRYVECFDDYDEPYDVLLDDFEPGMKTAEVRAVFDRLKEGQVPLVAAVRQEGEPPVRGRTFPIERPEGVRAEGDRALRVRPVRVAARHGRASVRGVDGDRRHQADDPLLRGQPRRPLRDDARDRPRALRARRLARPRAHAARARRVARPPRVPEPDVGEHGRPQPPVLALLLSAAAGDRSRRRSRTRRSTTGTAPSTGSRPR